jgi:hypothetical protein
MISPTEELKEVTKLVLYGWGYPALFTTSDGELLQNRMVQFPLFAKPAIEGANKAAFRVVRPKLELVKANYLEIITQKTFGVNPLWIWVDTPKNLTEEEILNYQQQFMVWATQRGLSDQEVNRIAPIDWRQFISPVTQYPIAQIFKITTLWKQVTIAIGLIITLLLAHLLASPVTACPTETADGSLEIKLCVDTIVASPPSIDLLDTDLREIAVDTLSDRSTVPVNVPETVPEIVNISF